MCGGYDDITEVWVETWVRARKPRQCCACCETIQADMVYHRHKTLEDGVWCQVDHCVRCWKICEALWKQLDGDAIDLRLDCGEVWKNPPPNVMELAFEAPQDGQEWAEHEYQQSKRTTAP